MWKPIASVPEHRSVQLAVIDGTGEHALSFPCRANHGGWMNVRSGRGVDVRPTHWRLWEEETTTVPARAVADG